MATTNFHITGGSAASDVNGGGPRLGTNDGPTLALTTNVTAVLVSGTTYTLENTDNTGWGDTAIDDCGTWDAGGTKERFKVTALAVGGDTDIIQVTAFASITVASAKSVNICGAWANDLALTFLTTAYVNAAADPPKLNIKGNASITLSTARITGTSTVGVPIAIAGYSASAGDLEAETWPVAHGAAGFLTTTGYPTLTLGTNALTLGDFTGLYCCIVASSRAGNAIVRGQNVSNFRVRCVNTANSGSAACVSSGTGGTHLDCEYSTSGASSGAVIGGGTNDVFETCRITSVSGDLISTSAAILALRCLFYGIASGKTGINSSGSNNRVRVHDCTFNGTSAGVGVSYTGATPGGALLEVVNCQFTNLATGVAKLLAISIAGTFYNNRFRDCTPYTGWLVNAGVNDVTTDSDDATEYVDAAGDPPDLHLKSGAYGLGVGLPIGTDIGAWQRETDYPAVGNVDVDDTSDGAAGTLVQPTEAQVELGVGFGASGTEFTGSLSAGGHVQARVRTGY